MPLTFDPSNDFLIFDGLEEVALYRRTGDATFSPPVTVPHALRFAADREFIAANNLLGKETIAWCLWANDLPANVVPKKQDVLQDGTGVRWRILSVNYRSLIKRYQCECVREP